MKNLCFLRVTGKAVDRNYLSIIKRRERRDVFVERVFMAKKLTNDLVGHRRPGFVALRAQGAFHGSMFHEPDHIQGRTLNLWSDWFFRQTLKRGVGKNVALSSRALCK